MDNALIAAITAGFGLLVGWLVTVPVHRFKEFRPKTPRNVAQEHIIDDETGEITPIRATYRSARCPNCHHAYSAVDVIPVISWFRGCPECGESLPGTVPLIQLGIPVAMVATVATLNESWIALPFMWFILCLAVIAIVDLRIWLIPYWMPWVGAAVGFGLITVTAIAMGEAGSIQSAVIGAVGSFVLFFILWFVAPGKLGFSDVRLALLLGLFLGWLHPILPVYGMLIGSVLGLLMGAAALLTRKDSRFPFGPALALGALITVWCHSIILPISS